MYKLIRLSWLPAALCLSACDVQVNDTTPAQYQANNDIGMYEITATASQGALVTPGSLVLFAIGENQKVPLSLNSDGSGWHGLYSVRCQSSFPLQILAVWRLQGLATRNTLVPAQARQVKLTEPPLTKQEGFDTAAKPGDSKAPAGKGAKGKAGKGEWEGTVNYRFVTVPVTQITSARLEPSSASGEDTAAARAISVKTPVPLQAACGENAQLRLVSTEQRAHGTLIIDTDNPGMPRWQTYVEFSPK
jgi:RES domain-containing protein